MRHPFDMLVELNPSAVRLDCAALQLARDIYPHIEVVKYTNLLDQLAHDVEARRPGIAANLRYEAMRSVLVDEFGLHGETDDYYDPENSFLNRVLDRRCGVPIAVSTIWIEVARRLKWPVYGASFPGHFLIRFDDEERFIVVDPFREGRSMTDEDCQQLLDHCFDGQVEFSLSYLEPVGTRQILARMLNNLRSIYTASQDWTRLEWSLKRLAALEPDSGTHVQELAALHYRQGNVRAAFRQLQAYLHARPSAPDARVVRDRMTRLEALVAALN